MDYNNVDKIGKIKEFNKKFGVGEIVSIDGVYKFTINDINEELNPLDIVKFRGEVVNDVKRAFFVKKIENDYELKNRIIKSKLYNKE